MKAGKVIGIVGGSLFGLVGVGAAVGYFAVLSPPSPESVCDNVSQIHEKEGRPMSDADKAKCVAHASKAPEFGRVPWVKQLKCMRDATSSTELDACQRSARSGG